MSDELPTIQKAQPVLEHNITRGSWVYTPFDIERERAGYEKREQQLKKQMVEIAKLPTLTWVELPRDERISFVKWCHGSDSRDLKQFPDTPELVADGKLSRVWIGHEKYTSQTWEILSPQYTFNKLLGLSKQ